MGKENQDKEKKVEEKGVSGSIKKKVFIAVLAVGGVVILYLLTGFHVINGSEIDVPIVVKKESMGFKETFINVDKIADMRRKSAKKRYPISVKVLVREGMIESDQQIKQRLLKDAEKKMQKDFNEMFGDMVKEKRNKEKE